jgi:hypothetical protein
MIQSSKILFIVIFIAMISLPGIRCINPFAPRIDSELSTQTCSDFRNIENLFCAFRNAYAFKDTNLYGSLIDSKFTFSYRDYDHGVDISWGRDDEMRSTYGLFQSVQSISVIWNTLISSDTGETRRSVVRGFNLTVTFNPGDVERIDGYANLVFTRATADDPWKLIHWRDESNF